MIKLTRRIERECTRTVDARWPIIVTLEPGDMISFRPKRCQARFRISVEAAYNLAVRQTAEHKHAAKRLLPFPIAGK